MAIIATVATGCSSVRRTTPERTATEQILLSRAVDRALERLEISLPPGTTVYMDPSRFEAYDRGYAISALRDRLLVSGVHMVDVRDDAEVVVEIRSGALSTNENEALIGIPSFSLPIPLAGDLKTPELAVVKQTSRRGIAKIAFTAYWTSDGALADRTDPVIGISGYDDWKFLGLGWHEGDVMPNQLPPRPEPAPGTGPAAEKDGSATRTDP
ncbi:MAG TPA: DUF6655 family protein [Thalassobaculum sp.]